MIFRLQHIALLALSVFITGCATDRTYGASPDVEITQLEELPVPRGQSFYVVGPQEKLEITVANSEALSGTYLSDEAGRVSFPFLGALELDGKSPSEAERMIEAGLRGRYVLDPQVRVIPEELPPPSISVGGQVRKPGSYSAMGKQTLLTIINRAEGLQEYAQLDDVLVMRTVGGQRYIGAYSLEAIQRGNYADPQLYPNDIVMVGDSPTRRRIDNLLQFVPLLSSSAIIIDRLGR